MNSDGFGEMFEGDSADTLAGKFQLVSMGCRAEGLACADPVARTPIGASGKFPFMLMGGPVEGLACTDPGTRTPISVSGNLGFS